MKIFRSAIVALVVGVASISSAVARDSFNIGINVGGYGYPQAQYYAGPPVVYYNAPPVVYYRSAPALLASQGQMAARQTNPLAPFVLALL